MLRETNFMTPFRTLMILAALAATAACSEQKPAAQAAETPSAAPDTPAALGTVAISPAVAQRLGIEAVPAGPASIRTTLTLFGTVQIEPKNVVQVPARYPGVIRSVVHQIGDRVAAGEPLARVESNESLQVYAVNSPIAGIITQRNANPGEAAGSEPLFQVVDASKVRIDLSVFPQDRARLKPGQRVRVTSSADAGTVAEATLTFISPIGSAQTQSIVARAALDNREGRWAPGQFVTADVLIDESRAAVTVAPTALQQVGGRPVVFVQTAQGFIARQVEVGRRADDAVEIRQGLVAGERYVAKNTFLLKAEMLKGEAEED